MTGPKYEPGVDITVLGQRVEIPRLVYDNVNRLRGLGGIWVTSRARTAIGELVSVLVQHVRFTTENFSSGARDVTNAFRMTIDIRTEFNAQLRAAIELPVGGRNYNFDDFTRRPVTGSHGGVYWLFCRRTGEFSGSATTAYQARQRELQQASQPPPMMHIPSAFVAIHRRRLDTGIHEGTGEPLTFWQRAHSRAYLIADGWIAVTPAVRTGMIAYTSANSHKVGGGQGNTTGSANTPPRNSGRQFEQNRIGRQNGVDPNTLQTGQRQTLESGRLQDQRDFLSGRTTWTTRSPIRVQQNGVIIDGHHGVRAAIEAGVPVDVIVEFGDNPPGAIPVIDLPIIRTR